MVVKEDHEKTPSDAIEGDLVAEHNTDTAQSEGTAPNSSSTYSPTDVVLAKVKGYPPWPAMVLEETMLPQNILDKRPKSVRSKGGKRGRGKPVVVLPVRFFSDDTYIWIRDNELKPMTEQMIETHLLSDKKRKDKLLEKAYKLAKNPPDMQEFVLWGSRGPPKDIKEDQEYAEDGEVNSDEEEEEDLQEEEAEETEGLEDDENGDEEDEEIVYGRRRKKQKAAKRAKTNLKSKKDDKNEPGYDSDWGLSDEEPDAEDYIFAKEEQQQFEKQFPKGADLSERFLEAQEEFSGMAFEITLHLLEENVNEKEVVKSLASVRKMDVPYTLLARSTLFKALVLVARKPQETFPYPKVKKEVGKVLELMFGVHVDENTPEMMEKEATPMEKEATPLEKDGVQLKEETPAQ